MSVLPVSPFGARSPGTYPLCTRLSQATQFRCHQGTHYVHCVSDDGDFNTARSLNQIHVKLDFGAPWLLAAMPVTAQSDTLAVTVKQVSMESTATKFGLPGS